MARDPSTKRPGADRPLHERLAWYLDEAFSVPGTGFRFGWDAILGLVPGLGDLVTGFVQVLLVLHVAKNRAIPASLLLRLFANVAIDSVLGAIPLLGDVFDAFFKANTRNVRLLRHAEAELAASGRISGTRHVVYLTCLVGTLVTLVAASVWLAVILFRALLQWLGVALGRGSW